MRQRTARLLGALLGLCLGGCSKAPPPEHSAPSASVVVGARSGDVPAPSPVASVAPAPWPRAPVCRALRVEGEALQGDKPLASGGEVDGSQWVTLARGARLTLKHSSTGRELAVAGPARFRACRRGREELLLAQGKLEVGTGMGVRPGAEVVVATPVAALRYADADFALTLDDKMLDIGVRAGQVELDPALPNQKGVKTPLHPKDKLRLPLGKPAPQDLMARCKEAAEAAEASARRVGDKSAPEPLGERAQAHVRARRAARAACTIAAAATGLVADPAASAGLWAEAVRWEGLWESIPRKGSATGRLGEGPQPNAAEK